MKKIYDSQKLTVHLFSCLLSLLLGNQLAAQNHSPQQTDEITPKKLPCTVSIASTPEICYDGDNATATVTVTSGTGPFTYAWTPNPGGGQGTAVATGLVSQFYTVIVTGPQGSCMGNTFILQPPAIALILQAEDPICEIPANGSASVTASGGTGPYVYSWNGGPDSNITAVNNLPGGVNYLRVTDAVGCPVTVTFNLQSAPLPITVTPPSATIINGDAVQLTASGGVSYVWSPAAGLSCTNCPNPYAQPDSAAVYTVTGTSADGCIGYATVPIQVEKRCSDVFVPTIFSPNGDGQNDQFCVKGDCIVKMQLTIFNRWGEKVYEAEDQMACWDGYFGDAPAETGAYIYKLDALMQNGKQLNTGGSITIMR